MWTHIDKKFSTPPPTWRKQRPPPSPISERKRMSPMKAKGDLFHVIHKVPAGDSPYGKAKHIQLVEKDPSRAVSMFWAAINAGDRVDSALKDMAVVMKQLNRPDEAIEAIKSFRHLCPYDSQESLDNVLIELYKRSGRIAEEIEMLLCKLKKIEEGIAFGGAKTKLARSQGKKIQITVAQERSRILGNLAWAYLQQNNYELAEQYYRKALSLEADKNKQCNLAICLMHMNRMMEAKSLLQAVKASAGNKQMDDSYAKSYDRAFQMLTELESPAMLERSEKLHKKDNVENQRPFGLPTDRNSNFVAGLTYGGPNHVSTINVSRSRADGCDEEMMPLNEQDRRAYCQNQHENMNRVFGYDKGSSKCVSPGPAATSQISLLSVFDNNWRKHLYLENQSGRSGFAGARKEHWASSPGIGVSCLRQETDASPSTVRSNFEVPFTQPRRPSWGLSDGQQRMERWGNGYVPSKQTELTDNAVLYTQPRVSSSHVGDQRRGKWGEKAVGRSVCKLLFEQAVTTENVSQNVNREQLVSTNDKSLQESENALPSPASEDWRRKSLKDFAQVKNETAVQSPSQPKSSCWGNDGFAQTKEDTVDQSWTSTWQKGDDNNTGGLKIFFGGQTSEMLDTLHLFISEKPMSPLDCVTAHGKKSWADMVEEEEEEESLSDRISREGLDGWTMEEEEFNNENINSNVIYPSSCPQNQIEYLSQKLEDSIDLQNGYRTSKSGVVSSKNQTVRRSLCFGQYQRSNTGLNSVPVKDNDLMSEKNINMKTRSRLQVFRDITPFPDSP
ncbi:hypothetical protein Pint_17775 [Pistacia integerrima]|uniref:Uncharacterized protein n=1 Tax=Pistacia integerrima TaxID=434235 RepID=A0ACC0Z1U2_9ROSI|nr:hypothetical protein Pint_17775 [Pistacia integerrima]